MEYFADLTEHGRLEAFVLAPRWISLNCLIPERFFVLYLLKLDRQLLPVLLPVGVESHLVKTSHHSPEGASTLNILPIQATTNCFWLNPC